MFKKVRAPSDDHQEMAYHEVKVRVRSDSMYSEFNEEDYDDGEVEEPAKPNGAATVASYMNLTNTCIGAVRAHILVCSLALHVSQIIILLW